MSEDPLARLDYASPGDDRLLTLMHMGNSEAELAAAKLRSEGIDCFIADQNFSIADPLVMPNVRLQVRARDVARARELLTTPAPDSAEGEYADETWRCPKCHRKTVEQLPLPPLWRFLRNLFWLMLFLPPVVFGVASVVLDERSWQRLGVGDSLACPWVAAVLLLSLPLILRDRGKHCTSCGNAWNKSGPLPQTPMPGDRADR